jgi:tight adherence protein B
MDPMLALIALVVTGAATFALLAAFRGVAASGEIVRARLAPDRRESNREQITGLRPAESGVLAIGRRLPLGSEARERMQRELDQAGMAWRANEYLLVRIALAISGAIIGGLLGASLDVPVALKVAIPVPLVLLGWFLPRVYVRRRRAKRLVVLEKQLPDALTAISKSLRAGSGLLQALAYAADETPAPLGPELASTLRDLQLGADPEETFEALADRMGSRDLQIAVTAINIQRAVGGNLSETLSNVTQTIRERVKIQNEVRVLTARQRLTANIMAFIPVAVAAAFISLSPDVGSHLINTTPGLIALAAGITLEVIGIIIIRRMAVIEV